MELIFIDFTWIIIIPDFQFSDESGREAIRVRSDYHVLDRMASFCHYFGELSCYEMSAAQNTKSKNNCRNY